MQNNDLLYASPRQITRDERFKAFMMGFAVYTPAFAFFNAGGFVVIYFLGYLQVLESAPWQLLAVAGVSTLLGVLFLIASSYLRKNQDSLAAIIMPSAIGTFFIGLNLFWDGFQPYFHIGIWIGPLLQYWQAARTKQKWAATVVGLVASVILYFTEVAQPFERMTNDSNAAVFGFWFLLFAIIALVTLGLLLQVIVFRSLSTRLLASFIVIVILPLVITTTVSGLTATSQNEQRIQKQLDTISQLKRTQIEQITGAMLETLEKVPDNSSKYSAVINVLIEPRTTNTFRVAYRNSSTYLKEIINQNSQYQELFVLDTVGRVVITTTDEQLGRVYNNALFFQRGLNSQNARVSAELNPFLDLALYGQASLFATQQVKSPDGESPIGLVVLRTRFDPINQFILVDPGMGNTDESYLVNDNFERITPANAPEKGIRTEASIKAIEEQQTGTGIYANSKGEQVIGAYHYIANLNAAIITEINYAEAQGNTRLAILANILLSLFALGLAGMAVTLTARTISNPIVNLAETVKNVSQGKLSERANVQRDDEIGTLAISFNSMADELQKLVTALEARVSDRTRDLEKQAARLRVASEIARDAASARNLEELLNRSAQLILDRFDFYHTGLFLLDHTRTYAILRASPTPAGQEMLARQHQLRVGETGIVGYVAATGEPRVVLDIETDATYFRNPLLPNTRSELALPLKVENRVIGVLDVQSEQPGAFKSEDIATLQIMADQLGTAIERARILQEFEQTLAELERASQTFTQETWQTFTDNRKQPNGYHFEGFTLEPLTALPTEARQAFKRGQTMAVPNPDDQRASLAVPVKLRGHIIGVINVKLQTKNIPGDTAAMLEEAANRLGFALENSRLIAESQQRANRERAIANASAKIGASRETEQIMRAAVEELQRLLGDPEVAIQLKTTRDQSS